MPRKSSRDRWHDLCQLVADDDRLPVRPAGLWTEDKLYYWNCYLGITTSAMVGSPSWSAVVYVDLFAGPGVLELRESGRRIPGSALLAAHTRKPFDRLLICEKDPETAEVCEERLRRTSARDRFTMFVGDCNVEIERIAAQIPSRALTLAFIDPEGLHAHFETLASLSANRRVDLLILLADSMDAVRNVALYRSQDSSNLDRFLGAGCDWRTAYDELPRHDDGAAVCELFQKLLCRELRDRLGYSVFSGKVMRSSRSAIYRVVYASKSAKGLEFWNKISSIDVRGQKTLDF